MRCLFCTTYSLLQGSFAKETYNLKEPTNHSHPISADEIVTWDVPFAEYRLFYRALLQKRPIILMSLLIVVILYKPMKSERETHIYKCTHTCCVFCAGNAAGVCALLQFNDIAIAVMRWFYIVNVAIRWLLRILIGAVVTRWLYIANMVIRGKLVCWNSNDIATSKTSAGGVCVRVCVFLFGGWNVDQTRAQTKIRTGVSTLWNVDTPDASVSHRAHQVCLHCEMYLYI